MSRRRTCPRGGHVQEGGISRRGTFLTHTVCAESLSEGVNRNSSLLHGGGLRSVLLSSSCLNYLARNMLEVLMHGFVEKDSTRRAMSTVPTLLASPEEQYGRTAVAQNTFQT